MSSPSVFDSEKNAYYFGLLNGSSSFRTVDYDAHINTKMELFCQSCVTSPSLQKKYTTSKLWNRTNTIANYIRNV